MLTDKEIQDLIASPKKIVHRSPKKGYKEGGGYRRCSLKLEGTSTNAEVFSVYIRQNNKFIENYSIGLNYKIDNDDIKAITLLRYNGPHGEHSRNKDGHFKNTHIHHLTAEELDSGSICPQESHRKITDKYHTFEEAIKVFFEDIGAVNVSNYFTTHFQVSIFHEH